MVDDPLSRLTRIGETATVKTVFGDPVHQNGRTIIPVAKIRYGFGFGRGRKAAEGEPQSGEGGGGGVSAKPVAVLEIDDKTTQVKPIIDVNRLALAGMLLVAWNVFWVTLTIRATRGR